MAFINQAVTVLQTLVIALGAGLAVWGVINLMEGYGNDNPAAKSQGIKQLMAGGGVVLIGTTPADWNAGVFSMIRQISETAILQIAGVILTFVMTYELIQMLIERNNLHDDVC